MHISQDQIPKLDGPRLGSESGPLMTLDSQSHVVTLEEFYIRAGMCWKHMETDLTALKNDPPTTGALLPKLIFT